MGLLQDADNAAKKIELEAKAKQAAAAAKEQGKQEALQEQKRHEEAKREGML